MKHATRPFPSFLVFAFVSGCLDPLVPDDATYSVYVLPPGTPVPELDPASPLALRIAGADAASTTPITSKSGSAAGAAVSYWDLGTAPRYVSAFYRIAHCDGDGGVVEDPENPIETLPLVTTAPGDPAYSPYLREWIVCVRETYRGEVLPSMRALSDAQALGLVDAPIPTSTYRHLPIFAPGVAFDVGNPDAPALPSVALFYEGHIVYAMPMGGDAGSRYGSSITRAGRIYRLRNNAMPPISETVFSTARGAPGAPNAMYAPLFRVVHVVMANTYVAGSATKEADLFTVSGTTLTPANPAITSFELTDQYIDAELRFTAEVP